MHPFQALVNGMNAHEQEKRAASGQWTLGQLISELEKLAQVDPSRRISIGLPHSYRGYYCDLSFGMTWGENDDGPITVQEALERAQGCMGEVFQGYKGGDYTMGRNTPIWCAAYGNCGDKIVGLDTRTPVIVFTLVKDEY